MSLSQTGKRLSSDDLVARASDCVAIPCANCAGDGFLDGYMLCPACQGSRAVLVPKVKQSSRLPKGIVVLFFLVAEVLLFGFLLWEMFR
jgi:RecJ-like exonuclease